jgi:chaperonin GroES
MAKTKTNLNPLDDRVVVKRLEAEEKTAGGIVLPDSAKEKPQKGEVLAVGPGKLLDNGKRAVPEVKPGDIVLFGKYSGNEVELEGDELVIIRMDDILARF